MLKDYIINYYEVWWQNVFELFINKMDSYSTEIGFVKSITKNLQSHIFLDDLVL